MASTLNVLDWMYAFGRELAQKIKADGKMGGPIAASMLQEAARCTTRGKQRTQARALLKKYLISEGVGDLMKDDEESEDS